jgi:limonene 1,2-monooxygenase
MEQDGNLRFGAFMSPVHSVREDLTRALDRDVQLIERLEQLDFSEVWVGEHHSTGWECIASPEIVLSYAAARTSRIRLGAGGVALPFHHPLHVLERFILLDHLSRGRVMLGMGPGALPYDADQIGIGAFETRPRMEEALEAIVALLSGERVSMTTEWFTLDRAALQLMPYKSSGLDLAIAATTSPGGPRLAGRHAIPLVTAVMAEQQGFDKLSTQWSIVEEQAAARGHVVARSDWRLAAPMHVAETRAQAFAEVEKGIASWAKYYETISTMPLLPVGGANGSWARTLVESGSVMIGTPDDAAAYIEQLQAESGGFGTFLVWANDWANPAASQRSLELIAGEVAPRFTSSFGARVEAAEWASSRRADVLPAVLAARERARLQYDVERGDRIV